jgi:hypothetical protein
MPKSVKTFADVLQHVQYSRLTFPSLDGDRWITISFDGYEIYQHKKHAKRSICLGTTKDEQEAVRIAMKGIQN